MARTRWLAFDDTDRRIRYEGPWETVENSFDGPEFGSYGPTYGGSQHATTRPASLSFPFTGSRVRVFGTTNVLNESDILTPRWECFVDGVSIGFDRPWPSHQNNYLLCSTQDQTFGEHTLTLEVYEAEDERPFYVDQIRYLPLANMTVLGDPTVIIDQMDPDISYSGEWVPSTEEATLTLESGASLSLNFTGTKATWMGWTPSGFPTGESTATYSVDGGDPVTFAIDGPTEGSTTQFFQRYFETPELEDGSHILTVTHVGTSAPLVLDYFLVENGNIIHPDNRTLVPDPTNTSTNPSPTNSDITSTPEPQSEKKSTPIGAIVGGAVGGVVVLALVAFLIFFFLRRKRRQNASANEQAPLYPYNLTNMYERSGPTNSTPNLAPQPSFMAPVTTGGSNASGTNTQHTHGHTHTLPQDGMNPAGFHSVQRLTPLRKGDSTTQLVPPTTPTMFVTRPTPGDVSVNDSDANTTLDGMRANISTPPNPFYSAPVGAHSPSSPQVPKYPILG